MYTLLRDNIWHSTHLGLSFFHCLWLIFKSVFGHHLLRTCM